jgi:hypothetical protein
MIAGFIAGLMPLVHAHSFVVTMAMGGCLALLQALYAVKSFRRTSQDQPQQESLKESLMPVCLPWIAFFGIAVAVPGAVP